MLCPNCKGAKGDIVFWGKRKTVERGEIQRFKCNECGRTWCEDIGFKRKKKAESTILAVLSQYWKGLTSRELADEHSIDQKTVLSWIHEYACRLYALLGNRVPRVTKRLHLDELFLRMGGKQDFHYVWDAICAKTRFVWILLSPCRDFVSAKRLLDECPLAETVVSDGAFSYPRVIRERYHGQAKHHQCVDFEEKKHNNLVERLQNTLRRFLHPRRGFASLVTGINQLHGFWVYYNFIRKHSSIGMTPAEKAGVIDRWRQAPTVKSRLRALIAQTVVFWLWFTNRQLEQSPKNPCRKY
jgi:putative transposase